jgi:hypothetical protein
MATKPAQALGMAMSQFNPPIPHTASFVLTKEDVCGIHTTRGATGAVTFTLPDPTADIEGAWVRFINLVDQNMTVRTATADTLVTVNDTAADSIAISTASQKIGAVIECYCDGTNWIAWVTSVGITGTIAT